MIRCIHIETLLKLKKHFNISPSNKIVDLFKFEFADDNFDITHKNLMFVGKNIVGKGEHDV